MTAAQKANDGMKLDGVNSERPSPLAFADRDQSGCLVLATVHV
jgi:hypothetical protein